MTCSVAYSLNVLLEVEQLPKSSMLRIITYFMFFLFQITPNNGMKLFVEVLSNDTTNYLVIIDWLIYFTVVFSLFRL
ncbi:MAG: hypothetical protein ACJAXM_001237 [Arenicella sp.]|jgi:hypothetical protein